MKLRRQGRNTPAIVFEEIEPFFLDLLRQLPGDADPGDNAAARDRLHGSPMSAADDGDEFIDDWREHIEPEIRDLFRSARDIVAGDLAPLPASGMAPTDGEQQFNPAAFVPTRHILEIPPGHAEAWLSILNQARLVIAAKRGFEEEAMDEDLPFPPLTPRDVDLFKVHFFDFVQQVLLRELGYE